MSAWQFLDKQVPSVASSATKLNISRIYQVKPNQVEVESPSTETKLTIYTCTLGGTYDGRVVVEAKPE